MPGNYLYTITDDGGNKLASSGGDEQSLKLSLKRLSIQRQINKVGRAILEFIGPSLSAEKMDVEISKAPLKLGTSILIKAAPGTDGNEEQKLIFSGVITKAGIATAAGYYQFKLSLKEHNLTLVRETQSWMFNDKTDKDIVSALVKDQSTIEIEPFEASIKHEQRFFENISTWGLISQLGFNNGCIAYTEPSESGVKVKFVSSDKLDKSASIDIGDANVLRFSLDYCNEHQYAASNTSTWDFKKQEVPAAEQKKSDVVKPKIYGKTISAADITFDKVEAGRFYESGLAEKEAAALSEANLHLHAYLSYFGELQLRGQTEHAIGDVIEINKLSDEFKGPFLISGVSHEIQSTGWVTTYRLGVHIDDVPNRSLNSFYRTSERSDSDTSSQLYLGVVQKFEKDKENNFRVPVILNHFPKDAKPIWARVSMVEAGGGRGMVFWPEKGDEVIVGFIGEELRTPVILGSLFSASDANKVPEGFEPSEKNNVRGLFTKKKLSYKFDDTEDSFDLVIDDKTQMKLDKKAGLDIKVEKDLVSAVDGAAKSTIKDKLSIAAQGAISVEGKDKISAESKAKMELKAASGLDVKSDAALQAEAKASLKLKSSATLEAKGSVIKLN